MVRIISAVTAVVAFVAFSPVFGQESMTSTAPVSSSPMVDGGQKGGQHEMTGEGEGKGKKGKDKNGRGRGHGHDKKRGLDRADEVAREHGKHGRDRARGHDKDKHDEGDQHERD